MGGLRLRKAVRAVLLDPDDRVFLVQVQLPSVTFWQTPGGGVKIGESPHDALLRELHEEVGNADFDIGPLVWTRTHLWSVSTSYDGQTDTIFLVRVETAALGDSLLSDEELRDEMVVSRGWWTLQELQGAATEFSPTQLPTLVADLLSSGPPDTPIDVGF